jgi:hypothetical protein
MEKILTDALTQAPSLVVLVIVVYIFIKHLQWRDNMLKEEFRCIHEEHLDARNQMRVVLSNHESAMRELATAVIRCNLSNINKPTGL